VSHDGAVESLDLPRPPEEKGRVGDAVAVEKGVLNAHVIIHGKYKAQNADARGACKMQVNQRAESRNGCQPGAAILYHNCNCSPYRHKREGTKKRGT